MTKKMIKAKAFVDVEKGTLEHHAHIVIEKDRIVHVESGHESVFPDDVTVIDLSDHYILPGLINSHAHGCFLSDGRPFVEQLEIPPRIMVLVAEKNVNTALLSGVTTIRDCGDGPNVMFALRRAIEMGITTGPRLFLSGQPLTMTGGHIHQLGGEVDGPDEMVKIVRQQFKAGADFIKLIATGGGTPGTYPGYSSLSLEEMTAAATEAHRINKTVTAHARGIPGIINGVDAGLDHLEHVSFETPDGRIQFDPKLADKIAEKGIFVTPTIQLHRDFHEDYIRQIETAKQSAETKEFINASNRRWEKTLTLFGRFLGAGIKITAGNDAGLPLTGFGLLWRELDAMVMGGMTTIQAITAATKTAAEAMKLDHLIGSIKPGLAADIIGIKTNPLDDITALADVTFVMNDGHVIVDTSSS